MKFCYGDKELCITPPLEINKSSKEITFNDIVVDFTGLNINDLPIKFQQVQVKENDQVIFTGYVNEIILPEFRSGNEVMKVTFNILSPLAYATKRLVNYSSTGLLSNILINICNGLVNDGYNLILNIEDVIASIDIIYEPLEKALNRLANKYGLWWYIDEELNIYVNQIDALQIGETKLTLNRNSKITNFKPEIIATDYANKIIGKNAIVYDSGDIVPATTTVQNGEIINFEYPIHLSENGYKKRKTVFDTKVGFNLIAGSTQISELYDTATNTYISTDNYGYAGVDDDDVTKLVLFIRDEFISTKITGFKWNGTNGVNISAVSSEMILKPYTIEMVNNKEVELSKDLISDSGLIEKVINLNGKYYDEFELVEYIKNQFSMNKLATSSFTTTFVNELPDLNIGDKINLNISELFSTGSFIITNINKTIDSTETSKLSIEARNINLIEDYLSIFRTDEEQEDAEATRISIKSFYIDETTNEVRKVYVDGELQDAS